MLDLSKIMPIPQLSEIKTALFVQPHPDDNQIAAGGLIAKLIADGAEVYELTVCDDRYVDIGYTGEGLTTRQKEILAAQKCLGMKNAGFLAFGDKTNASVEEITEAIVEVIRKVRPDAVFSADPDVINECHRDHVKVGQAVKFAAVDAECDFFPSLIDGKPRTDTWPVPMLGLYYTDRPNLIVDITDYYEKKMEAVGCHESQTSLELMVALGALAEKWGENDGFEYAESFRLIGRRHMHCYPFPVV